MSKEVWRSQCTVKQLKEALATLKDDSILITNDVGNLLVLDWIDNTHTQSVGYIDFGREVFKTKKADLIMFDKPMQGFEEHVTRDGKPNNPLEPLPHR